MFLAGEHIYISTACLHDRHELCRLECKYCNAPCWCDHHYPEGTDVSEQPENPTTPDETMVAPNEGDDSLDEVQPGAQPNEADNAGYLAGEDDGPSVADPGHGLPGEAEPLPDGDADTDGDGIPDEDEEDLTDSEPEEIDESVTDDEGTPSELDEDDGPSDG